MTLADIPERLEMRCLLPVDVLRVLDAATVSVVICYNAAYNAKVSLMQTAHCRRLLPQ